MFWLAIVDIDNYTEFSLMIEVDMNKHKVSREFIYVEYLDAKAVIADLAIEYMNDGGNWESQSKEYRALIKASNAIDAKLKYWNPQNDMFCNC